MDESVDSKHMQAGSAKYCWDCKEHVVLEMSDMAIIRTKILGNVPVLCRNAGNGCQEYVPMKSLFQHVKECQFRTVGCYTMHSSHTCCQHQGTILKVWKQLLNSQACCGPIYELPSKMMGHGILESSMLPPSISPFSDVFSILGNGKEVSLTSICIDIKKMT